jgi:hypothetical protein
MNPFLLILSATVPLLAVVMFMLSRRRFRSGPGNNWRNEASLAREADGSWTENECAVGREDAAPNGFQAML